MKDAPAVMETSPPLSVDEIHADRGCIAEAESETTQKSTMMQGRISSDSVIGRGRADEEEEAALGARFGFLIHDISRLHSLAYTQAMRPSDITRARRWVLANLARHDGMIQSQLASILQIGRASLGSLLDQLEKAQLIERHADPIDKRGKRVYLSRTARTLIQSLSASEFDFNRAVLSELSMEDRRRVIGILSSLRGSLRQMEGNAG